jgi:hypothetical protein
MVFYPVSVLMLAGIRDLLVMALSEGDTVDGAGGGGGAKGLRQCEPSGQGHAAELAHGQRDHEGPRRQGLGAAGARTDRLLGLGRTAAGGGQSRGHDIWSAYRNAVQGVLAKADIVHDKVHLCAYLNKAVDTVHKAEHRQLTSSGRQTLDLSQA